jgi:hypothetical protein
MSAQTAVWRQTHHLQTRGRVGEFFNELGAEIVGGKVSGNVNDNTRPHLGDFTRHDIKLRGEVKGSNNTHHWRLSIEQMERNALNRSRPFVYLLASYKSNTRRKNGEKRARGRRAVTYSGLARISRKDEQFAFFASSTDEVYLLDIRFIQELMRLGVGRLLPKGGFGDGHPDYEFTRTQLRSLNLPSTEAFEALDLSSADWTCRKHEFLKRFTIESKPQTLFSKEVEYRIETKFLLFTVLTPRLDELLTPIIKWQNDFGIP